MIEKTVKDTWLLTETTRLDRLVVERTEALSRRRANLLP